MENITIFADIIRVNISFVILGTSPKEYYSMEILDKTDLQILRVLQNNSRLTTKELAAKVNLSPTPVFERVKRLEANGYIKNMWQCSILRNSIGVSSSFVASSSVGSIGI